MASHRHGELAGWGHWRPGPDDQPDAIMRRGHDYDLLVDFALDDAAAQTGLALLADRMCDVAESHVLPTMGIRGASGQVDLAYVTDLGGASGRYIPSTWRTPVIVLDLDAIAEEDDPVAAVALAIATALSQAWGDARHGRGDVDEQARVLADAYRILIDEGAPWRGSSMPART